MNASKIWDSKENCPSLLKDLYDDMSKDLCKGQIRSLTRHSEMALQENVTSQTKVIFSFSATYSQISENLSNFNFPAELGKAFAKVKLKSNLIKGQNKRR